VTLRADGRQSVEKRREEKRREERRGEERRGEERRGEERRGQDKTRQDKTRQDKTRQDKTRQECREMAWLLGALAAPEEASDSSQHPSVSDSSFRGTNALFWSLWAPAKYLALRHICRQNTHTQKLIVFLQMSPYPMTG